MKGNGVMRFRIVTCLFFVLIFCTGFVNAFSNSGAGSWGYYRTVTVTETSGSSLFNYQIVVNLDTNNFDFTKTKYDGSDIRFSDTDNNELDYWIEDWQSPSLAKIYVKIPTIPASGTTNIKIWYNNPFATSSSNGEATFEFFDDFQVGSLDTTKWNAYTEGTNARVEVSGGICKLISPSYKSQSGISSKASFDINTVFIVKRAKFTSGYDSRGPMQRQGYIENDLGSSQPNEIDHGTEFQAESWVRWVIVNSGNAYSPYRDWADVNIAEGTYYISGVGWQSISGTRSVSWYKNYQRISSMDYSSSDYVPSIPMHVFLYSAPYSGGERNFGYMAVDYAIVRKYAASEPIISVSISPLTTTPIPSVGQAARTYQVGFDGLSYNADGRNTLDLDLQKARRSMATVAVYSDRVEIYQRAPDGVLVTFRGDNFAVFGDKITGPVTIADYMTDPVEAPLTPGMVSGSVRASFPSLTQPGMLRTTISDRPDSALVDQFRSVMEENGLAYDTVTYTFDVRKSTMPPSGNAVVTLTLPEQWVNQHGGISAVRIIRVSDTTGAAELVPVFYNGTDKKGIMQFRGTSVNGTSVFGLITIKASRMAQDKDTGLIIVPMQQPAIATIIGLFSWLLALLQQNPAGALAIVATASAAYAGRRRGMW